jgi:hypothetical protein
MTEARENEGLVPDTDTRWWVECIDQPASQRDLAPGLHEFAQHLLTWLRDYGRHHEHCRGDECKCGWTDVRAVIAPKNATGDG